MNRSLKVAALATLVIALVADPTRAVATSSPAVTHDSHAPTGVPPGVGIEILESGRRAFALLRHGKALSRFQLLSNTGDLAKMAGELIEAGSPDARRLDLHLRGIDEAVGKLAEGGRGKRSPG